MIYIAIWPILRTKCTQGKRQFGNNSCIIQGPRSGSKAIGPLLNHFSTGKNRRNDNNFWDYGWPDIKHVQKALDYNSPSWGLKLHSKYKVKQKQSKAEPRGAKLSQAEPS